MTTDFFERQDTARRNTKWLLVYYPIALVLITVSVYLVAAFVFTGHLAWNAELLAYVAIGTLMLIFGATLLKVNELRGSGGTVARMLGGVPVDPNTRDPDERKLLNVVEEMAIASGTPVPEVWVLRKEPGINAFAAGHDINDAAVAVTDGAMKLLSRDELQGVMAHEFSHILHGDVRLNVRVLGLLHGILILALIGRVLMRTRGRKNPLPLAGLGLFIIGSTGFFFGKLIKSAVSRQREYLADSAAVQFTRNPLGLAGALKKIGGLEHGSKLVSSHAEEASHFFFANGVSGFWAGLMSTHPPLDKRIRLLDPAFDGKYPVVTVLPPIPGRHGSTRAAADVEVRPPSAIPAASLLRHVGAPKPEHIVYASDFREKLPAALYDAAHEPMEAIHLIFALLLVPDPKVRAIQFQQLQNYAEPTRRLSALIDPLPATFRLPLVSLTLPTLKRLSRAQYREFARYMEFLVACDKQVDLFEYTLKKIVSHHLEPARPQPIQYYSLRPLLSDCAMLISALARLGCADPAAANTAFQQGMNALSPEARGLKLLSLNECGLSQIDEVLTRLAHASPAIKERVLHACTQAVAADNLIQAAEGELLRAIAETLDCPIPPFIQGVT